MATNLNLSTNYKKAVNWLNNSFVLCNNIPEVDSFVYDNMRFSLEDEEGNYTDIYQWYISDCSLSDVEFLEEHFNLFFTYSDLLDAYILCVDHYGTSWNYVHCYTDLDAAACELGE